METRGILVLDFGSQYTQLIGRRLRELGYFCELHPFSMDIEEIRRKRPLAIVLSGGPSSVHEPEAPRTDVRGLLEIAPVLGVCYGMQLMVKELGGKVTPSEQREYGRTGVEWLKSLDHVPSHQKVWMSHGDVISQLPSGVQLLARSKGGHPAAISGETWWALQFHPEVTHTEHGIDVLKAFLTTFVTEPPNWTSKEIVHHIEENVREQVSAGDRVLCALSGGVDSTVVATLLTRVLGKERVKCVFVDTGFLRKSEFEQVLKMYERLDLDVTGVKAQDEFYRRLKGVSLPEEKRRIIGHTFIDVFKQAMKGKGSFQFLGQGTLYPDVIESVSPRGASVTIKTHHNVGGLPKDLGLKLIEPVRELFKDEVRRLGRELGLPDDFLGRHPFPGPGLAIRILGEADPDSVKILQECDAIYIEELKNQGLYDQIWQAFCVLTPIRTVGVQGDFRTYERVLALRAVTSVDGMTADWFTFDPEFLRHVSGRITNEVRGVNRVVYDVTSKPPGTIEWE